MAGVKADPVREKAQLRALLDALEKRNPIMSGMLEMMALTGLRYVDICKLEFQQLKINGVYRLEFAVIQQKVEKHLLTKGSANAKSKARVIVTVTPQIQAVVDWMAQIQDDAQGLIFANPDTGKAYTAQWFNKTLKKIAAAEGLNYQLSVHSFRKTFAMMVDKAGGSTHEIKELLGHARLSSTEHYLSALREDKARLVMGISF